MKAIIICIALIHITIAQLCAQEDSLTHILDDIQDDDLSLSNWLELVSEQFFKSDSHAHKRYPKILLTHRFQYTLEKSEALTKHIFLGSPYESFTRLKLGLYKNLMAGGLIQKDVGEPNHVDHFSGYIAWNHPQYPLKLILGNYVVRFAEGLLLSGPFTLPNAALIRSFSPVRFLQTRPFLSSNEYDGFWGGTMEIGKSTGWRLIAFYSQITRDGILSDDKLYIKGFDRSGYHRTFSERARENLIKEEAWGGVFSFPLFFVDKIGLSCVNTRYNPSIKMVSSVSKRRRMFYKYHGSKINNFSIFYLKNLGGLFLSGEIVPLNLKELSHTTTVAFSTSDWHFLLKSWFIPPEFQSPYGRIPSHSNPFPNSVQGFLFGGYGKLFNKFRISVYWFIKKDLWRTYFQPLPVRKKSIYFQSDYNLSSQKLIYFRYQITNNSFYPPDLRRKADKTKHRFRIQLKQTFNTNIRSQTRIEFVYLNYSFLYSDKSGFSFFQDIYWRIFKPLTLQLRLSSFSTDDYDTRLYEYESDLPNVFSNFPLYGRGRKWYVMMTFKPLSQLKIWIKYRRITYDNVEYIGNGVMKIPGDMRQDLHCQLQFQY